MNNNNTVYFKILAIFDFILAGLSLLYGLLYAAYFGFVGLIFSDPVMFQEDYTIYSSTIPENPLIMMKWIFLFMAIAMLLVVLAFATLEVLLGIFLLKRKNYYYCLIMGAVTTLVPVYGTILGSFTMILLANPENKALFQKTVPPQITEVNTD